MLRGVFKCCKKVNFYGLVSPTWHSRKKNIFEKLNFIPPQKQPAHDVRKCHI